MTKMFTPKNKNFRNSSYCIRALVNFLCEEDFGYRNFLYQNDSKYQKVPKYIFELQIMTKMFTPKTHFFSEILVIRAFVDYQCGEEFGYRQFLFLEHMFFFNFFICFPDNTLILISEVDILPYIVYRGLIPFLKPFNHELGRNSSFLFLGGFKDDSNHLSHLMI